MVTNHQKMADSEEISLATRKTVEELSEEHKALLDMLAGRVSEGESQDVRLLRLKAKRPGVAKMLGSSNPLKDDEFADLRPLLKVSREKV